MNPDDLVRLTSQALWVCVLVSMPTVLASAFTGLLVAMVQAVLSLQDQSISHGIKLAAVSAVLLLSANWMGAQIFQFGKSLFAVALRP